MGLTKLQASILSSWYIMVLCSIMDNEYCTPMETTGFSRGSKPILFVPHARSPNPRQIHRSFAWSLIEHHFSFCGNMPGSSLLAFGNPLERPMIAHVDHPFWGKIMSQLCAAQKKYEPCSKQHLRRLRTCCFQISGLRNSRIEFVD
jgi:hypothetical protein